jgi:hypothetical protein
VIDEGLRYLSPNGLVDQAERVGVTMLAKNPVRPEVSKGARGKAEFE